MYTQTHKMLKLTFILNIHSKIYLIHNENKKMKEKKKKKKYIVYEYTG
jgi:hypothetical protein